jgi:hypothetical protein
MSGAHQHPYNCGAPDCTGQGPDVLEEITWSSPGHNRNLNIDKYGEKAK